MCCVLVFQQLAFDLAANCGQHLINWRLFTTRFLRLFPSWLPIYRLTRKKTLTL